MARRKALVLKTVAVGVVLLFVAGSVLTVWDALSPKPLVLADLDLGSQPAFDVGSGVPLVVFESPACPACAEWHLNESFSNLIEDWVGRGLLRLYYLNAPDHAFPYGPEAEVDQECMWRAGRDAFWVYTTLVYRDSQSATADPGLKAEETIAGEGLDAGAIEACRADPSARAAVAADHERARRLDVESLPAPFLVETDGRLTPLAFRDLEAALEREYGHANSS